MTATTSKVFTVKTDAKLYGKAQVIAGDLGFSISSLVNAFLKDFTRTKTVHFTLVTENGYTPEEEEAILRDMAEADVELASGKAKLYRNAHDLTNDILYGIQPSYHKAIPQRLQKVSQQHKGYSGIRTRGGHVTTGREITKKV